MGVGVGSLVAGGVSLFQQHSSGQGISLGKTASDTAKGGAAGGVMGLVGTGIKKFFSKN